MKKYSVYIAASISKRLYIGVTNDIMRRMTEHKLHAVPGFTDRYNITKLVHVEETKHAGDAITREKELKGWRREKKIRLIEQTNPQWHDLSS